MEQHTPKKMTRDLRGIGSPLDLLKCKACLKAMDQGDLLEVKLADQIVAENLSLIINRSGDEVLCEKQIPGGICLGIKRGQDPMIRVTNNSNTKPGECRKLNLKL